MRFICLVETSRCLPFLKPYQPVGIQERQQRKTTVSTTSSVSLERKDEWFFQWLNPLSVHRTVTTHTFLRTWRNISHDGLDSVSAFILQNTQRGSPLRHPHLAYCATLRRKLRLGQAESILQDKNSISTRWWNFTPKDRENSSERSIPSSVFSEKTMPSLRFYPRW